VEEIRLSRRNVRPKVSEESTPRTCCLSSPLLFIANLVQGAMSGKLWPFLGAVVILARAGLGFYASTRGKFLVCSQLVDGLKLCGQLVEVPCSTRSSR